MSINPYMSENAKIASLQYEFNLKALESEREYLIYICTIQEGEIVSGSLPLKLTNQVMPTTVVREV